MESLLSLSFDHLTSPSPTKIRKGLRQLEGLLAQLTLSTPPTPALRRQSLVETGLTSPQPTSKPLSSLPHDPAFREFYRLQNGFQYNVTMHLISTLERLLGKSNNGTNDLLIIAALDLIQGVLLLHPPSRELWAREIHMNLFLDLLDPSSCPAIHISTLQTLTAALLDHPTCTRLFESLDGLLVVTSLFKSRHIGRETKLKLVEFLYFYLGAERDADTESGRRQSKSAGNTEVLGGRGRELVGAFRREGGESQTVGGPVGGGAMGLGVFGEEAGVDGEVKTRTPEEKQALLGRYLSNVQDLVEDMREARQQEMMTGVGGGVGGAGLLSRGNGSPVRA